MILLFFTISFYILCVIIACKEYRKKEEEVSGISIALWGISAVGMITICVLPK